VHGGGAGYPPSSGTESEPGAGAGGSDADPRRMRRILANRQSAQKSRLRKLQYIQEMEGSIRGMGQELAVRAPALRALREQYEAECAAVAEMRGKVRNIEVLKRQKKEWSYRTHWLTTLRPPQLDLNPTSRSGFISTPPSFTPALYVYVTDRVHVGPVRGPRAAAGRDRPADAQGGLSEGPLPA
jgi:hypothetical protein